MNKVLSHYYYIFLLITLIGCSSEAPKVFDLNQLTRIDSQTNNNHEVIIAEEEQIQTIRGIFNRIEWEQNVKAEMVGREDVKAHLFFTYDQNMPERIVEYDIWFNHSDESGTIIDRENNALGKIDREDAQSLKGLLLPF